MDTGHRTCMPLSNIDGRNDRWNANNTHAHMHDVVVLYLCAIHGTRYSIKVVCIRNDDKKSMTAPGGDSHYSGTRLRGRIAVGVRGGGELIQAASMVLRRNRCYISILGGQELAVYFASYYLGTIPVVSHLSHFGAEGIKPSTSGTFPNLGSPG